MIGTKIGNRYRLEIELGRGGMGVVYRARDTLLKRDVALKLLSKIQLGTEGPVDLLREAQVTAGLNHPNIVTVYDAGQVAGSPYIVMELVEGASLQEQRPNSLNEVIAIARQICAALGYAHGRGIIHRDLKPGNVVITAEGSAKLMDFGLAQSVASQLRSEGAIVGTVFYLAPELAMGGGFDARVDLYSLGVMLYELTTGELPFTAEDPVAVISQHLHAPIVPPVAKNPEIPATLESLIVWLLCKEPERRPGSAGEVLEALERLEALELAAVPGEELSLLDRIVRGRLVGREEEIKKVRSLWDRAAFGEGQVLLISGEPGVGKSRLMRELETYATISGGQILDGAAYAEGGMPYAPFKQMLREAFRGRYDEHLDVPDAVLADLLVLAPELRTQFSEVPDNQPQDPQTEQQRLFDSMAVFLTMLAQRKPVLLMLDDAHWADSGTLSLLRHLARQLWKQRLMIVATYREVELDEARAFHAVLLDLTRERLPARIKLPRLDRAATHELLAILFAGEITTELLDGIYRETEGNPFFVEEVCKALVESGKLVFEDGRWHRPSIEELGIPQSIKITIQSRVRTLPERTQGILDQAAVLGRQFDLDTLRVAAEIGEGELLDALERAASAQLIEEFGPEAGEGFAFVHALIPATLVESARTLKRRRLHRRAAVAVEALRPDDFEALAYHWLEAGDQEKGVDYLVQAGDRARTLYAHQEATDNYRQALDFLTETGNLEQAARTQMKLALAYHNAFQFEASRRAYQEGFELWQRHGMALPAELPPAPHPLRLAVYEPPTLDPGKELAFLVARNLFSGLTELSEETGVVPDVARSWEMLEGGRRYLFHLREDVTWSDGARVTAADFEFAWKRVLDPASANLEANLMYDIKNAERYHKGDLVDSGSVGVYARSDSILEVVLEGPTAYFLQLLDLHITFPVPRHVVQKFGEAWTEPETIVTNGPFRLVAWEPGQSMILESNPTYHGRFNGNLQHVELTFASEANMAEMQPKYEADKLDHVWLWPLDQLEAVRAINRHAGEFLSGPGLAVGLLVFNTRRRPFDDPRVRRAFVLATDKEQLASTVMSGLYLPATGGLVPPGMPGHVNDLALPYDPEQARHLLAEAGYPGGQGLPRIEYYRWLLGERFRRLDDFLRRQWQENLGVEVDQEMVSLDKLSDRLDQGRRYLRFTNWDADYPDPDNFMRVMLQQIRSGWQNAHYDRLVEQARRSMNHEKRLELYRQAEEILLEEAPIVPLFYRREYGLLKPWVKNFEPSSWKDTVIETH